MQSFHCLRAFFLRDITACRENWMRSSFMLIWDIELTGSKCPSNDARTNTSLLYEMNKTIETFIFSCLGNLGEKQIWRKESGARKEGGKQRLYRCWREDPEEGLFLYDEG